MLVNLIESVYRLLWGDLFTIPLGGGIGISFMVVLLFTAGIWFTCRTRLLPVRLFRDMIAAVCEKKQGRDGLSSFQTLVISTATRVGMGVFEDGQPQKSDYRTYALEGEAACNGDDYADTPVRFDEVAMMVVKENRALLRHHVNCFGEMEPLS